MGTISNLVTLSGVTVVGKIDLSAKKTTGKNPAEKYFKPFSGGATLGERLKAAGISLR